MDKLVAKVRAVFGRYKEPADPTPVAAPIGFKASPPLHERIRQQVLLELQARAEAEGFETAEEADDFVVDDDELPFSPHELGELDGTDPSPLQLAPGPQASPAPSPGPTPSPSAPPVAG